MRNRKIIFLFLNQNICCGYSKEPSQGDGSFEHPKHMLKFMGKKILKILRENFCLSKPVSLILIVTYLKRNFPTSSSVYQSGNRNLIRNLFPMYFITACFVSNSSSSTCLSIAITQLKYLVKPVYNGHSQKHQKLGFKPNYRLMLVKRKWKHSVILSTFIKLPSVIKIFVFKWPLKTGFTVKES